MADEEMTEEDAQGLCKTCTVDTCRYNTLKTCAIKESIKQAFLAGLKAGRAERIKEIMKAYPDFGKGVGYKMSMVDELEKESCK